MKHDDVRADEQERAPPGREMAGLPLLVAVCHEVHQGLDEADEDRRHKRRMARAGKLAKAYNSHAAGKDAASGLAGAPRRHRRLAWTHGDSPCLPP